MITMSFLILKVTHNKLIISSLCTCDKKHLLVFYFKNAYPFVNRYVQKIKDKPEVVTVNLQSKKLTHTQ